MKTSSKNRLALIASLSLDDASMKMVNSIWTKYETGIHNSIKNHGPHYTLDHYKECYVFLRNIVLELSTQPIPWCKVDSDGIPKTLWPLRPLIKGDRNSKRIALVIARSYEWITLPIDYHPKSIEAPALYREEYQETTRDFKIWLKEFTNKYPWYLGSLQNRGGPARVFTTLSRGPNGPAVSSSHLDARAVVDDPVLYSSIKKLNNVLGQDWITEWMENMAETIHSDDEWITGRLGFSAEAAGKTRVFAIGDYWSQTSLKVIQDSLYNTLKAISTDSTANQNKGFKTLLLESAGKPTYCFDLSAASDRIPAEMQKFRLELLGGRALGEAWHSVMTDRTFLVKTTGKRLRWAVGQPLGLLSSFPSFALWHHDIVQFSYSRVRARAAKPPKFFKDYRILGDDVVIFNKEVADEYQFLITSVFLIEINMTKSVIGDSRNSQIEFAKRLALRGKEMSSIKRNILTKSSMQSMLELIDMLYERDFISPDTRHYCVYSFLSSKEQAQFSFLLWVRSQCEAPFNWVTPPSRIDRETFNQRLRSLRSHRIMEKTSDIDKLMRAEPYEKFYDKRSLPYSVKVLGMSRDDVPGTKLHPLVWALTQTRLDLSNMLSTIWFEQSPDVAPVEYLPIISSKSYFHTPHKASTEYVSKLFIEIFDEMRINPSDESLT